MGMAMPIPQKKWDDEHTVDVPVSVGWLNEPGTQANAHQHWYSSAIRVCKDCRRSQTLCTCAWRTP